MADAKRTVLIVEDDEIILTILGKGLEKMGWEIISAQSVDEAFRILYERKSEVTVIVTDLHFHSQRSGLEIANRMRYFCPVILCSGGALPEEERLFDGVVEKPIDIEGLSMVMTKLTANGSGSHG